MAVIRYVHNRIIGNDFGFRLIYFSNFVSNFGFFFSNFGIFVDSVATTATKIEIRVQQGRKHCGKSSYQHFLLFPYCFQEASFSGSLKPRIVWLRVTGEVT